MVQIITWYLSVLCVISMAFFPPAPRGKGSRDSGWEGSYKDIKGLTDGWLVGRLGGRNTSRMEFLEAYSAFAPALQYPIVFVHDSQT